MNVLGAIYALPFGDKYSRVVRNSEGLKTKLYSPAHCCEV